MPTMLDADSSPSMLVTQPECRHVEGGSMAILWGLTLVVLPDASLCMFARNTCPLDNVHWEWWREEPSSVLTARVFQRNRTNIYGDCIYKAIYYKELAHAIIASDKFQDLQDESSSWRPRTANVVPVGVWRPENQEDHPRAGRLEAQEEVSTCVRRQKGWCPSSKAVRQEEFSLIHEMVSLFVPFRFQLMGWGPPTFRRAICFYSVYWFKC